jgi:hypothetical protein
VGDKTQGVKKTLVKKKLLIGATVECNQRKDLITYVDKPTTVQQGGVGLGYVRLKQAKGKQDRRRVTGKTDT